MKPHRFVSPGGTRYMEPHEFCLTRPRRATPRARVVSESHLRQLPDKFNGRKAER
jgi:hypothetical protein